MALLDPFLPLIRYAAIEMHVQHGSRGWYDSHDLIGWLNTNHNATLNAMYALFGGGDPQMTGDQQIAKKLYDLGQQKNGEHESNWVLNTPTGMRSGRSMISIWTIDRSTWAALYPGP